MADKTDDQPASETPERVMVDGVEEPTTQFNPFDWGPDEVISKVYDCTSSGPRKYIGEVLGVPTQESLAFHAGPGKYLMMIRVGEACTKEGRNRGDIIHPNYCITIPGERTEAPTMILGGMIAGGVADSAHVPGADDVPSESHPPPPASSAPYDIGKVLGEIVAQLLAERSAPAPVAGVERTTEVIDLMLKLRQLQSQPDQVNITDIRGAFEEGEKIGDVKGYARAIAEHGNGDGSGVQDIFGVIGKVLEHPAVQQMMKAATAPVVSLDDLARGARAEPPEGASDGSEDD